MNIENYLIKKAADAGLRQPFIGESSNGDPVVVDTEDGRVFTIELRNMDKHLDMITPSIDFKELEQALTEGWSVRRSSDGFYRIRKRHSTMQFSSHEEAERFVCDQAAAGESYHRRMLKVMSFLNQEHAKLTPKTERTAPMASMYLALRTWANESVVEQSIIAVDAYYDPALGPNQAAVYQRVYPNQDLADLSESAAVPDITFWNSGLKFTPMEVHTDRREIPNAATCGACGHCFPICRVDGQNMKTVIIDQKRNSVARCPKCAALAHRPKARV